MSCANRNFNGITGSKSNGNGGGAGGCGISCENTEERIRILAEMKAKLSPLEYQVTQEKVTERPFSNRYYKHWESGSYHCVVCNTELFKSSTKFESKSGWPAFNAVIDTARIKLRPDLSHVGGNILLLVSRKDLARDEVSCSFCNAHIGHLFKDGPKPTGLRYCVNSNALTFIPATDASNSDEISNAEGISSGHEDQIDNNANKTQLSTICINNNSTCSAGSDNLPPNTTTANSSPQKELNSPNNSLMSEQIQQQSSSSRHSSVVEASASAASPAKTSTGKFCLFTQCLPNQTVTSSPETSPSAPKHYYKPSNNNSSSSNSNSQANGNSNSKVAGGVLKKASKELVLTQPQQQQQSVPPSFYQHKVSQSNSVPAQASAIRNSSGTVVVDPELPVTILTDQKIERISRRPSNGILRETAL